MPGKLAAISGIILGVAALGAVGLVGVGGMRLARADAVERVYRERLETLAKDYETLRASYNQAVRRTAVTELVVSGNSVTAMVRTAHGTIAEIPTGADPSKEIYVDFALLDGRVWIRRVFDSSTRPQDATVIDPRLAEIDWVGREPMDEELGSAGRATRATAVGQAVYRTLSDGRWVVRVSGDGALGLERVPMDAVVPLAEAPPVRGFDEVEDEARREISRVGWRDALGAILGN
jgi:hypothetical protein